MKLCFISVGLPEYHGGLSMDGRQTLLVETSQSGFSDLFTFTSGPTSR